MSPSCSIFRFTEAPGAVASSCPFNQPPTLSLSILFSTQAGQHAVQIPAHYAYRCRAPKIWLLSVGPNLVFDTVYFKDLFRVRCGPHESNRSSSASVSDSVASPYF